MNTVSLVGGGTTSPPQNHLAPSWVDTETVMYDNCSGGRTMHVLRRFTDTGLQVPFFGDPRKHELSASVDNCSHGATKLSATFLQFSCEVDGTACYVEDFGPVGVALFLYGDLVLAGG